MITPQENMAHTIKVLRMQAKDCLAMADFLENITLSPAPEAPVSPKE